MDHPFMLVCSALGTTFSIILSLAPIPAFLRAWKQLSLKEISRNYVFVSNINNLTWLLYSIQIDNAELIVPNCAQTIIGYCLIVAFFLIEGSAYPAIYKYTAFVFALTILGLSCADADGLGLLAGVLNVGSYLAPFDQVKMVLSECNRVYLDINVLLVALCNCAVWLTYGILADNLFIALPNTIGCLVCLLQLAVYMWASGILPHSTFRVLHDKWKTNETAALKGEGFSAL